MLEEIEDGDRQIVIRRQKPGAARDDAMPVVVRVAGKGDPETILQIDQPLHGIGRGRVHAKLAVPIDRHETERRIDGFVDDGEIQPVALGDRPPVVDTRAAERVDTQRDPGSTDGVHVDHVDEVARVRRDVVVPVRRGGAHGLLIADPLHPPKAGVEQFVRFRLDPPGDRGLRRPAVWRVVLEAAVAWRIVRGSDHDAVSEPGRAPAVVREDRVRHGRGRSVGLAVGNHERDPVCGHYFDRARTGRDGQGVRIHAEKQRAIDPLARPVEANRLRNGEHMLLVERLVQGRATMS